MNEHDENVELPETLSFGDGGEVDDLATAMAPPEPDTDDEADEDAQDEALFEKPKEDKALPKNVPYTRFSKAIGERNEARTAKAGLEAQVAELNAKLAQSDNVSKILEEHYARFDDPAAQVAFDAQFMDAFEKLHKDDPTIAAAGKKVAAYLKGETIVPENLSNRTEPASAQAAPKHDPRIDAIIERDAARTVAEVLEGQHVKPAFQKLIANHIIQDTDLDLTDLSQKDILGAAKDFIKSNGFSAEDVMAAQAEPKAAKPATASGQGAPPRDKPKSSSADDAPSDAPPKAPTSLSEWEAGREARLRSIFGGE